MNMRVFLILIYFSISYSAVPQNIENLKKEFWQIEQEKNDSLIIEKGVKIIEFIESNHVNIDTDIIKIRLSVALSFGSIGDLKSSLELHLKTNEQILEKWGNNNIYLGVSYYHTGNVFEQIGLPDKALEYFLLSLENIEELKGVGHSLSLNSLEKITELYFFNYNDYKNALYFSLKQYDVVLSVKKKDAIDPLSKIILCYTELGKQDQNNYGNALSYSYILLNLIVEKDSSIYVPCIENIVFVSCKIGDFKNAKLFQNKLLNLCKTGNGSNTPNCFLWYRDAGDISLTLKEYDDALLYYLKALSLSKEYPVQDLNILELFRNISYIFSEKGNHNSSIQYCIEGIKYIEHAQIPDSLLLADFYGKIGINYLQLNNSDKAFDFLLSCYNIQKKLLGLENEKVAVSLVNLANCYHTIQDIESAISAYKDALLILQTIDETNTQPYIKALNGIAVCYIDINDYQNAIFYLEKAVELNELLGDTLGMAYVYNNISLLYIKLEEFEKALVYGSLALEYCSNGNNLEPRKLTLASVVYSNQSLSFAKLEKYDSAFSNGYISLQLGLDYFNINRSRLNEDELVLFKNQLNNSFQILCNLISSNYSNILSVANSYCQINGLVYSNKKEIREFISDRDEKDLLNISSIVEGSDFRNEKNEHSQNIEMSINNSTVDSTNIGRVVILNDITKHLKTNEVLIQILRFSIYDFPSNNWTDSVNYVAFITDSNYSLSYHVFMPNANQLENKFYSEYSKSAIGKNVEYREIDKTSYNHFWKAIADKIGEYKTVYVSLGGIYNNINLNTLYNPETGKYLIEEKDLRIVNSARDFVLSKEREKKQYTSTTSALYGFPDFNGNTTSLFDSTDYLASKRDLSSMWIDSLTRGGFKASPLPATKVEVEQIASTFQKNGWKVTTYTCENASETNIKKEDSPRVLHVATHGYFFEDIPLDTVDSRFLGMERNRVVQDPMLRSGLLFTGANKTLQGEEVKGENGLLSAAEASLLDLRKTELVVLSACETGKGETKSGEGVYGLRKAFADAGAQNIIMSLWKVDDKVTQEFMTTFYSNWLGDKSTIRVAFNKTQLEIKAKYPQPYYWGAFILVGE